MVDGVEKYQDDHWSIWLSAKEMSFLLLGICVLVELEKCGFRYDCLMSGIGSALNESSPLSVIGSIV